MKKLSWSALLTMTLLFGLAVGAHAESLDALVVNVPFNFVVNGTTLPAGTYTVDRVWSDEPWLLLFRSKDGKSVATASGSVEGNSTGESKLIFAHYGDLYFLSEVQTYGGIHQFPISRVQRQLAKTTDHDMVSVTGAN